MLKFATVKGTLLAFPSFQYNHFAFRFLTLQYPQNPVWRLIDETGAVGLLAHWRVMRWDCQKVVPHGWLRKERQTLY